MSLNATPIQELKGILGENWDKQEAAEILKASISYVVDICIRDLDIIYAGQNFDESYDYEISRANKEQIVNWIFSQEKVKI